MTTDRQVHRSSLASASTQYWEWISQEALVWNPFKKHDRSCTKRITTDRYLLLRNLLRLKAMRIVGRGTRRDAMPRKLETAVLYLRVFLQTKIGHCHRSRLEIIETRDSKQVRVKRQIFRGKSSFGCGQILYPDHLLNDARPRHMVILLITSLTYCDICTLLLASTSVSVTSNDYLVDRVLVEPGCETFRVIETTGLASMRSCYIKPLHCLYWSACESWSKGLGCSKPVIAVG